MIVRLLKPWKYKKPGTILNGVPEGAANLLMSRGICEEVKQDKDQAKGIKRAGRP